MARIQACFGEELFNLLQGIWFSRVPSLHEPAEISEFNKRLKHLPQA